MINHHRYLSKLVPIVSRSACLLISTLHRVSHYKFTSSMISDCTVIKHVSNEIQEKSNGSSISFLDRRKKGKCSFFVLIVRFKRKEEEKKRKEKKKKGTELIATNRDRVDETRRNARNIISNVRVSSRKLRVKEVMSVSDLRATYISLSYKIIHHSLWFFFH